MSNITFNFILLNIMNCCFADQLNYPSLQFFNLNSAELPKIHDYRHFLLYFAVFLA
jgi:hypothetical protein